MSAAHRPAPPRALAWIAARPVLVMGLAGLVAAGALTLASRLKLKTAFSELLPSDDPGVVALERTQKRLGDMSLLLVGVHSPDKAANLRYAEHVTARLQALPPTVCALAAYHVRDVRDFFQRNKWLYASEGDLEDIRDRLRHEITKRKNPLLVDLGDDESVEDMRKRMTGKDRMDGRFPDGVFMSGGGDYVWIAALPPGGLFVERAGEGLLEAAQRIIREEPPAGYHPEMRVKVSGPIATAIAAREAVERDILWVTVTCAVLVGLSIALYFRRVRSLVLIGVPAVIGTLCAFGVAELAFGQLNSSTAFLGSIILGNGINYGIVLMSRYEEERARGAAPATAMSPAVAGTWRGTGVAAISASAAYASLTVTSFRGFSQFGVMGAAGAIACWLSTFTTLPAMLTILDRRGSAGGGRAPLRLGPLGRLVGRHAGAVFASAVALTAVGVYGTRHFLEDPFEYNFNKLNTRVVASKETQAFNKNMDSLFGRWPSPTVLLADRLEEVEPMRAAIRAQDQAQHGAPTVGQISTIYDLLPGPPEQQRRKLGLLAEIRKLVHDPALDVLTDKERADIAQVDPPPDLHELRPGDLPALARRPFTEVDGTVGRVLLAYPPEKGFSVWSGRDLLRMAAVIQYVHLPTNPPKTMETSGTAVVFGAMIRSILHDGPIATLASFLAVLVLIGLTMRPASAAVATLATLAVGVSWMVGAAGLAGVRVTFLNFIALPITFGIGAEYALNVVARYQEDRDIEAAVASTGGAVALCSWTTIVGYGSLLAARNQALQGFGEMAILGEVACLIAAILVLPAAILWRKGVRRRAGRSAG